MLIVVDDENRENEGDFIVSGEKATPQDINFMMKYGRGLICTSISSKKAKKMNLNPMVDDNTENQKTNFTVSVDAKNGITTGISAKDRWQTLQVLINDDSNPEDLVRPGHMFPLIAKDGGVLQRAGHTEACLDLAKLSKHKPIALLVEIVDDDGTMARRESLLKISKEHNIKIISIADKLDTITSCFCLGLIPTGSSDPYGLRRNSIGIIRIAESLDKHLNLIDLLNLSFNSFQRDFNKEIGNKDLNNVRDFFIDRVKSRKIFPSFNKAINLSIDDFLQCSK